MEKIIKKFWMVSFAFLILINVNFIFAETFSGGSYAPSFSGSTFDYRIYGSSVNPQFNNPSFFSVSGFTSPEVYWPKYNTADCLERQDFIMQIAPGGCSPSVVRSDLLEEQNVPVFCKIMALQVNPLIDISRIRSLRFTNKDFPAGVSSVSYYPAKAVLRSQTQLMSSPLKDNLGYLVVVLSRKQAEKEMPDFVEGKVTAIIDYDSEGAFGIGTNNFYLSELSDENWLRDYKSYGFWNGKGYARAEVIEPDRATIAIYRDFDSRQASVTLKKGETSRDIYLGGFYCAAGMNIRLDSIDAPVDSALIQVNDQQIWVSKGDLILNGKCSIENIETYAGGGRVIVNCRVSNGRFELKLVPGKAMLNVDGSEKEYYIGQKVREKDNLFLGYVGQDFNGKDFAVLIKDKTSNTESEFNDKEVYDAVNKVVSGNAKGIETKEMQEAIAKSIEEKYKIKLKTGDIYKNLVDKNFTKVILIGESWSEVIFKSSFIAKDKDWTANSAENKLAKEYYDEAVKYYKDLNDLYANEKPAGESDSYSSQGLLEAAELSKKFGMNKKAQEFYDKLMAQYPDSNAASKARADKDLLVKYDSSGAKAMVNINEERYFFDLMSFKKPINQDLNAVLLVNGKEQSFGLEELREIISKDNSSQKLGTLQVKEIKDNYININYFKAGTSVLASSSETKKLAINEQIVFNKIGIKLLNITFNKQVKITIIPKVFGPRTESNFTFKIGIEKRAIQLSPNKTKEVMDSLEETIKDWQDANNKLGEVIKVLKGVCFATSATLAVKNLITGFSGEGMARSALMTKQGGWNDFCKDLVENKKAGKGGTYSTISQCLLDYNNEIQNDIDKYKEAIEKTNENLKNIQEELKPQSTDILDFEGQVESEKVRKAYYEEYFKPFYENNKDKEITLSNGKKAKLSDVIGNAPEKTSLEDMKNLITFNELREGSSGTSRLSSVLNNQIGKDLLYTFQMTEQTKEKDNLIKASGGDYPVFEAEKGVKLQRMYAIKDSDSDLKKDLGNSEKMFIDSISSSYADEKIKGKKIKVGLVNEGGNYKVNKAVSFEGEDVTSSAIKYYSGKYNIDSFKIANPSAYQNKMKNVENLKVKYFEKAPYKGMPAEVPFDIQNGWYVEMTYVLSGFGKPYDESGRVVNFYICNVGQNGAIEFKQSADDICRYYNGDVNSIEFPGMTKSESTSLAGRAQQAISEAGRQYSTGKKGVQIGNHVFKSAASFAGEDGKCSDFMSPIDCNIMFNVCDPVICPASRCDLGGSYRVDNVVQTGILGSLVLCLPNIREGILMPVCLSGVHAGVENVISVFNQTHACLKESLASGRNIGICDQITSVYLCEFFWKEATPFVNVLIPRLVEFIYSQGVRGGGEYLTVQSAWDNTQSAIDYFKNQYAINSMQAFTARSTEEAGTEVCRSFMSVVYPNSADLFSKLLEPDSPVQFTGWFSEDILTTATIPSTSHYKVYYHIYSGKDQNAYYFVYLKDLPASNQISLMGNYIVDSGNIQKGSQIDISRDFTSVSGYKQMCIAVNGQEQCGFGKVSTAYSVNALSDAYASEQVQNSDIKNEKNCIAGTPSALSLVNINVQQGVEQVLNPELYASGIIRVCSTENPGKKVDTNGQYDRTNSTYDRWKIVGYCDDPTIKCWLDTSSVKDVIKDKNLINQTLAEINQKLFSAELLTEEDGKTIANEAQNTINNLIISNTDDRTSINKKISSIVEKLKKLLNFGVNNQHRARGTYLMANLYRKISEKLQNVVNVQTSVVTSATSSITETSTTTTTTGATAEAQKSWTDDMLREKVDIVVNYAENKQINFTYSAGYWTSKNNLGTSSSVQSEITGLDYIPGIDLISKSSIAENGNSFMINNIEIEGQVFSSDFSEELKNKILNVLKKTSSSSEASTSASSSSQTATPASTSFQERTKQNPENFVYKIYNSKDNTFIYYIFDKNNANHFLVAYSKSSGFDWEANLVNFKKPSAFLINVNANYDANEPLKRIKYYYPKSDGYVLYYIDRNTKAQEIDSDYGS